MRNIVDRQTFIFSIDLEDLHGALYPSILSTNIALRFAADELVVKSVSYSPYTLDITHPKSDLCDVIQIWCNITNDGLICAFPNSAIVSVRHNESFTISNKFQTGSFVLEFQQTANPGAFPYNPQNLISAQDTQRTFGSVSITIEFLKTQ